MSGDFSLDLKDSQKFLVFRIVKEQGLGLYLPLDGEGGEEA